MPNRIIRDEILDSDRYLGLSSDTARVLFLHMLLMADDLGNLEAGYGVIRRRLLPGGASPESATKLLSELADADLIRLYEVGGKRYAHLMSGLSDKCQSSVGQVSDSCLTLAVEGREGKEEKRAPQRNLGSRLPADWQPDELLLAWTKQERPDLQIHRTVEAFRDYWHAKAGRDATKVDWGKTFRTWVRNERKAPGSRTDFASAASEQWKGAL